MANIVITDPNAIVFVSQGDVVEIDIPGGGQVTFKAAPGETVDRFTIHFKDDSVADTASIDLATFSENGLEINIQHYDPSDTVELIGGFNMGVDPDNDDEFSFSYIGATGNTYTGYVHAKDGGEKDFNEDPTPVIICFAEGTIIDTALGPRPVESILIGDLVKTENNGLQPVRWIGQRKLDSMDLARQPQLYPVVITAGALGNSLPYNDLRLSPQHRVQVNDWRAEYLFGESQVLVAAKHLTDGKHIYTDNRVASVCYYHLLFDCHEIVFSNGVKTESLHPGDLALRSNGGATANELRLLFPDIDDVLAQRETANMVLRSFEGHAVCAYAA